MSGLDPYLGDSSVDELCDGPDEGVHTVGGCVGWAFRGPGAHLVLKLGKRSDVVDFALFVEGRYRLSASVLATAGVHCEESESLSAGRCAEHLTYKVAAVVGLANDPVGAVLFIESYRALGPGVGGHASRTVCQNVAALVGVHSGDDYACLVTSGVGRDGGVYGYDNLNEAVRGALDPGVVYPLSLPQGVFRLVEKVGVDFLSSCAGALVLGPDMGVEAGGEVVLVVVGGAPGDYNVWAGDKLPEQGYGLGCGCDYTAGVRGRA